ncbi:MATE family efflux transporter [Robiginitomaculum antarcticum]|uniref:MATE family efflux transporter n=1 Tax=Robiginitomaculum antarcticum TaxID=437507 RepID=UPI00037CFC31|nr:MATE family efflux transporter [Robiginitomaculum antarcticum]
MSETYLKPARKAQFPSTWGGELKAFLALGFPIGLGQLISFVVYTIDAAMIGRLGETQLAASSLGLVIFFLLWMLGSGAVFAVTPLVSQALGRNQNERRDVRMTVRMSFWLIAFMTPFALIFGLFVEPMALALGQDPVVSQLGAQYTLTLIFGWPFALMIFALRNFLSAFGRVWMPMVLISLTTLFNVALNWILIYGNLGFPRLELVGAGIASSLSYVLSFTLFAIYVTRDSKAAPFRVFRRLWRPDWSRMRDLITLGFPITVMTLFEGMLFNVAVLIVGAISVSAQAAYQVGLNVASLSFMVPFGLAMAGSVRVGLAVGAQNLPALKRSAIVTFVTCVGIVAILALGVAFGASVISRVYLDVNAPENAAVVGLIAGFLPIVAGFMVYDAAQVVANQLLRGLKDVNWPMIFTGFSYWVIGFPICYWLGLHTAYGANGVWYGLSIGLFFAFVLLCGRFIYLVWMRPERIIFSQNV